MEQYLPLVFSFLIAGALAAIVFFLWWVLVAGPRRIRRAVMARSGPAAIQNSIRTSFLYWLLTGLLALVLAIVAGCLCWYHLGYWLYADTFENTWQSSLASSLSRTFWVFTTTLQGFDYAMRLPIGMLLAGFLGLLCGAWLGTKLGRKMAARRFLLTSLMS